MSSHELKLIDAHCHINFSAYRDDADEVIRRSLDDSVGLIAVGSQSTTSQRAVEYTERHENIWAIIGLHPIHLFEQEVDESESDGGEDAQFRSRAEEYDPEFYRNLAQSKKVVGIGECGLDYYHVPDGVEHDDFCSLQEKVFRAQLDLALELDLAVMVHSRDAADGSTDVHSEIKSILREYRDAGHVLRGDVHCFSGSVADMRDYIELGFYVSFTGNLTYKPRKADIEKGETLHDVARETPLDRILVETDAPYLTPVPHRGERNEPAHVRHVADKIAEIKGLSAEEVYAQTLANTGKLFRV